MLRGGSRQQGQGITFATNSFTKQDCVFLAKNLEDKYALKTSVIKAGFDNQWKISVKKESMGLLVPPLSPLGRACAAKGDKGIGNGVLLYQNTLYLKCNIKLNHSNSKPYK